MHSTLGPQMSLLQAPRKLLGVHDGHALVQLIENLVGDAFHSLWLQLCRLDLHDLLASRSVPETVALILA